MRLATLLAIITFVIIASYSIAFRSGDMTIMMVMPASAIVSDVVRLLAVSITGLVARLQ